jgi:hypothetical protein
MPETFFWTAATKIKAEKREIENLEFSNGFPKAY